MKEQEADVLRELDMLVKESSNDVFKQEVVLLRYQSYIIRCASRFSGKFITKSDDEWSIALQAFVEALNHYSYEQGNFLKFAELVIKRRLTDYYNANKKHSHELSVDPCVFSGESDDGEENVAMVAAVREVITYLPDNNIKDEIEAVNQLFKAYGFSFYDLISCSPKSEKTKKACAKAVACICKNAVVASEMKASKMLPLKLIEKNAGVPRKILERHRKYIIAAVEILSGEYPYLAEYLQPIRKEL